MNGSHLREQLRHADVITFVMGQVRRHAFEFHAKITKIDQKDR